MKRKGSASASQNFADFIKGDKKEQDPVKKKAADKLLRQILCEQWWIVALALPLSFLGAMQEFATSHFIGRALDAMRVGDTDELNSQILTWAIVLSVGSLFAGIRDYLYAVSSEKIGSSVRALFF